MPPAHFVSPGGHAASHVALPSSSKPQVSSSVQQAMVFPPSKPSVPKHFFGRSAGHDRHVWLPPASTIHSWSAAQQLALAAPEQGVSPASQHSLSSPDVVLAHVWPGSQQKAPLHLGQQWSSDVTMAIGSLSVLHSPGRQHRFPPRPQPSRGFGQHWPGCDGSAT